MHRQRTYIRLRMTLTCRGMNWLCDWTFSNESHDTGTSSKCNASRIWLWLIQTLRYVFWSPVLETKYSLLTVLILRTPPIKLPSVILGALLLNRCTCSILDSWPLTVYNNIWIRIRTRRCIISRTFFYSHWSWLALILFGRISLSRAENFLTS